MSNLSLPDRLAALRRLMQERQLDAYVVPSEDAHASEYLAPCDARRAYLTGFTGSAGCAVVTLAEARCWTDGRYWLQAEAQLGEGWTLVKQGMPNVLTWGQWLKTHLPASRIGIDPHLIPCSDAGALRATLEPASTLVPVRDNLVDLVWAARPARPAEPAFRLEDRYAGEAVGQKLVRVRERLRRTGSPAMVVSSLDDVAWLFNLRGDDIPYNPVFFAYAIVTRHDTTLFATPAALSIDVRTYLHANNVAVLDYSAVWASLEALGARVKADRARGPQPPSPDVDISEGAKEKDSEAKTVVRTDKVLVGTKTSWAVATMLGEDNVETRRSIVEDLKAKKNATEFEGFRRSHIRDGAALVRYFAWLEEALGRGESWTEYDAAEKLEDFRKEGEGFMGLSFDTISSTNANAAIIHYSPPKTGSAVIDPQGMYLCDSGAQYLDGTTDVTRTLHFGRPTYEQRRAFTRVLQGHIALDVLVIPTGTTGYVIDSIARRPLWSDGLDYRHGTGHGVGHFLNVHEGPHGIGPRAVHNETGLEAGMVVSNEPGYYADGRYGIRIENVVGVKMAETRWNFGGKGYLEFEHFTMCPIQTKLVELDLLAPAERHWLNAYHAECRLKLEPVLRAKGDARALAWLERECAEV
ncbi:hypothetical protein Q5752_006642 [Cryptotrichosporon argae]